MPRMKNLDWNLQQSLSAIEYLERVRTIATNAQSAIYEQDLRRAIEQIASIETDLETAYRIISAIAEQG